MGRLVMGRLEVDEENMEIKISDIQRINHVPEVVKEVIRTNLHGRRLNKNGLPSVLYLGPNRIQVVGAFSYGSLSFLDIEGKWTSIVDGETLVCITAYYPDKTYEELKEGRQEYIKSLKERYPNGLEVKK